MREINKIYIIIAGIVILAILSIIEYMKYGDEEAGEEAGVEGFAPPSEVDVLTDVQLKDYINYTYGDVTSAEKNCDKITKLQTSLTTYLQMIYNKSLTTDGRAALKQTYPTMLATEFDIDIIQSLYIIGTTLPPKNQIVMNKGGQTCFETAVNGSMGDVDNAIKYLYYFYSKPTPTTPKPTDPPPAFGAPPSSVDVSTDDALKSFLTTCYITVTRTQTETGGKYSDCAKMNWCGLWIPSILTPVANNNSINELLVNYPSVFTNNYDVDAFYGLVISASNLSDVDADCEAKNVNSGLTGAYRDLVKHLIYFYGKPHKLVTSAGGDRIDTQR